MWYSQNLLFKKTEKETSEVIPLEEVHHLTRKISKLTKIDKTPSQFMSKNVKIIRFHFFFFWELFPLSNSSDIRVKIATNLSFWLF